MNIDPLLAPLANNGGPSLTHALLPGSPAVDAGDPLLCRSTDGRGLSRFGACDIGAYEVQARMTAEAAGLKPGEATTYTIAYHNGHDRQAGITMTDTLPSQLLYVGGSLSGTAGSGSYQAGLIHWQGTVAANQTISVTFQGQVSPTYLGLTMPNKALIHDGYLLQPVSTVVRVFVNSVWLPFVRR
jgi:uncharacterized repeat protein (TIGR01451 family)